MNTSGAPRFAAARRLFLLICGIWVGSLFVVGYLVVPTILSANLLLLNSVCGRATSRGAVLGCTGMATPFTGLFGRLHGISSGLFLRSFLGFWVV